MKMVCLVLTRDEMVGPMDLLICLGKHQLYIPFFTPGGLSND